MVFKQYYLGCLAHASYLIADEASGLAAVVDPQRDVEQYLDDAAGLSCRISDVFLTHFHADFVAGHLELRERAGAVIRLGAHAEAEYPFIPMGDGDSVALGDVRLTVIETPGHSPESISILVHDRGDCGAEPHAVLTGDTLFIGDVGRPDLRGALGWSARELAGMLYDSLHGKLTSLPDATLVYPAHGAGSLCGKNLSSETVSTIGVQRAQNYALAPMSRERFMEIVTTDLPDAPAYFTYDAVLNTRERPTLEQALAREVRPLALSRVLELAEDGAQLLDTREPAKFEAAHLKGSINVCLNGSYATWCGTLLDPDRPIVVIAEPGREVESAMRLGRIAFDSVDGYLDGGMQTLAGRPGLVARIDRITAATLAERLRGAEPPLLIDVRAPGEWQAERIEAAVNVPLSRWPERMSTLPRDESIVVHCGTGYRSAIAASLLQRDGYTLVSDLIGGIEAWPTD
jgi:hydroxyacylglutathione hydrolase